MFGWDAAAWVGIGLTVGFGVVGIVLAVWFWLRPRSPKASHEQLRVEVSNEFPVFDHPGGSSSVGDHLVGVTVRNGSTRRARVTGWGIGIPGNRTIVVPRPTTGWEPPLPYWVEPGDAATWYLDAAALRAQSAELSVPFDQMIAFVRFADGRQVSAEHGVLLA